MLGVHLASNRINAQLIADFESFNTNPPGYFAPGTTTVFTAPGFIFPYQWNTAFGGYWAGGWAYTNAYDSTTAGFTNLYGVKAYSGYNQSAVYAVGQDQAHMVLSLPGSTLSGFYITNTTYAYKAIKFGDAFCRKFGDTSGTFSGGMYPQGGYPDYFKLRIKAFRNGMLQSDSIEFYLADYRSAGTSNDFVLNQWAWCSTSALGRADSLEMRLFSSDIGSFGINTPLFFAIDEVTLNAPKAALSSNPSVLNTHRYNSQLHCFTRSTADDTIEYQLCSVQGTMLFKGDWNALNAFVNSELHYGFYILNIKALNYTTQIRCILYQ
jgi:hypothetical protein